MSTIGGMGFLMKSLGIDPEIVSSAAQTIIQIGEQVKSQLRDILAKQDRVENYLYSHNAELVDRITLLEKHLIKINQSMENANVIALKFRSAGITRSSRSKSDDAA